MLEVLEVAVVDVDVLAGELVEDGPDVAEGADGLQRGCGFGPEHSPESGDVESAADVSEGHAPGLEVLGEASVTIPDPSVRRRQVAQLVEDGSDVGAHACSRSAWRMSGPSMRMVRQ